MDGQAALRKLLNGALVDAKVRNPSFSLRAFARRLELSPAALSEILGGKRRVSRNMATRVLTQLGADASVARTVLDAFPAKRGRRPAVSDNAPGLSFEELSMDHFRSIADWYHFAICALSETRGFRDDPEWISRRLKHVSPQDVELGMKRLEKLGMLVRENGRLRSKAGHVSSSDDVVNLALRKSHAQDTELVLKSLQEDEILMRDISAITMAIDVKKLPQAKKLIRRFQDQICELLEDGPKTEVYKLCVQLIPLTAGGKEKDHAV